VSLLHRQLLTAALTANAVRPVPGYYAGVPAMVAGWLTSELAPHLAALTAADAVRELGRRDRDVRGLALAGLSLAGLGTVVAQSAAAKKHVDAALVESLGPDYRERLSEKHTDLDLSTPLRQLAWPFRLGDDEVEVVKDVPYAPEHGRRGLLDLYRPRDRDLSGAPVLLQVHGGAWTIGSKDHQGIPLMLHMAARGWVCVAINYRLSPRDPFPAQVVDVKRALAWVREHGPAYGADPAFVAVTGGSAGGHLAALAALTPGDPEYQPGFEDADTSVAGCVPFYGVYDMAGLTGDKPAEVMRDTFLAPRVFKKDPVVDREEFVKASPIAHVSPDSPDFFVLHGTNDTLVDVRQARAFVEKLKQTSKRTVTYAEFPGAQHAFEVFGSIRSHHVIRAVERWLLHHHALWKREQTSASADRAKSRSAAG
jgi:acetyl esterase/lipase